MKYYCRQPAAGYERLKDEGRTAWAELFEGSGFGVLPQDVGDLVCTRKGAGLRLVGPVQSVGDVS